MKYYDVVNSNKLTTHIFFVSQPNLKWSKFANFWAVLEAVASAAV